jgi:hypothetical protein
LLFSMNQKDTMDRRSQSWSEKPAKESSRKSLEQLRHENVSYQRVRSYPYGLESSRLDRRDETLGQARNLGELTLEKAEQATKNPDTFELFQQRYHSEIEKISDGIYQIKTKVRNSGNFQYENTINIKDSIITLKYNYRVHDINHGGSGALHLSDIIYNQLLLSAKEYNRSIESFDLKKIRIEHILNVKSTQILNFITPSVKNYEFGPQHDEYFIALSLPITHCAAYLSKQYPYTIGMKEIHAVKVEAKGSDIFHMTLDLS